MARLAGRIVNTYLHPCTEIFDCAVPTGLPLLGNLPSTYLLRQFCFALRAGFRWGTHIVSDPDSSWLSIGGVSFGVLQNPNDRKDRVPIARRRRCTEQFVQLAEVANRLHVAAIQSKDKSAPKRENSNVPLPAGRNCHWKLNSAVVGFRQDANEADNVRARGPSFERIVHLQVHKIAAWAEHNVRFEWQLTDQFCLELCSRPRFSDHKRARGPHVHNIVGAEFFDEHAWAKRPVAANVNAAKENNKSHSDRSRDPPPACGVFYSEAAQAGSRRLYQGTASAVP